MRLASVFLACLIAVPSLAQTASQSSNADWKTTLLQWRQKRAQKLAAPDGWLAVVGLDWLKPGDNKLGSDPSSEIKLSNASPAQLGVIHLGNNSLVLQPPAAGFPHDLAINGTYPSAATALSADIDPQPSKLTVGTLIITIIHRGDKFGVRIKDSAAPARVNFKGLHWYAPNRVYRVRAKWVPYDGPEPRTIPSVIGIDQQMTA